MLARWRARLQSPRVVSSVVSSPSENSSNDGQSRAHLDVVSVNMSVLYDGSVIAGLITRRTGIDSGQDQVVVRYITWGVMEYSSTLEVLLKLSHTKEES